MDSQFAIENARKHPRTVKELSERTELQFVETHRLIQELHQQRSEDNESAANNTVGSEVTQLLKHLRGVLDCAESVLAKGLTQKAKENESSLVRDLTRALTLSGNGERFELAIEAAIRAYCEAREDVRKYSSVDSIPDNLREDIVAGFTRSMEGHRVELRLLGVEIEAIELGAPLDIEKHDVIKKIATRSTAKANTVGDCITPLFRWKNGEGIERLRPAKVAALVAQPVERESTKRKGRFF